MILDIHFISVLFMLGIGSYLDVYNNRMIPVNLFVLPGAIGLISFFLNFTPFFLVIILLSISIAILFDIFHLWGRADTFAFIIIILHYDILGYAIFLISSLFTVAFWGAYLAKDHSMNQIIRSKIPFLPSFLFGFILVVLIV